MIYGNITYATLTGGTTQNAYEVRLGYQVLSEDVANNSRQVKLQLEVRSVKSNYYTYGFNQTTTIDGTTLSSAGFDMRNINVWQIFGSRTITINGAYSGTKTGSFVTDASTAYGQYTLKSGSASVSISLATLHKAPVINSISVTERNSNLSGVSGTTFVANLSNKRFSVTYTTYDSATITSYKVYQNNSLIGSSSSNAVDVNYASVDMYYTGSGSSARTPITVSITDSMGATTTSSTTNYTVIPYIVPNIITTSSQVKRNGQVSGKVNLTLVANAYRGTIGNTTNGLTLSFAYWIKGNSESSTYYTIPSSAYSISGNTIRINNWGMTKNGSTITDVNKNYNYYFKIKIQDSYYTRYATLLCAKGEWIMAKFKDRVDFKEVTINQNKYLSNIGDGIRVYSTSEQTISPNTSTKILLNTIDYNTSSKLTFSNGRVTIGSNVKAVLVNCRWTAWGASNYGRYVYIYKNGDTFAFNRANYSATMETTAVIPVSQGDYIEMWAYQDDSSNVTTSKTLEQTFLQVTIIG